MADLPDTDDLIVALDTETSGLHVDSGSRVAVVSYAFREPVKVDGVWVQKPDAPIRSNAIAFDQGVTDLPLGPKVLDMKTQKRIDKTKPVWIGEGEPPDGPVDTDDPGSGWVIPNIWFYEAAPNLAAKWWDWLMAWMLRQRVIYHNAKFDLGQIGAGLRGCALDGPGHGVDLEPSFWWDTMLAQSIIDPRSGIGLKPLAERLHLGAAVGMAPGMEAAEQRALGPWRGPMTGKAADPRYDLIPWRVMKGYATTDAVLTVLLQEYQAQLLCEEYGHWWSHIDRQFDLCRALYRMERRGIGFDVDGCTTERDRIEIARAEVATRLPFEPTPDKARHFFFDDLADGGCGAIPRSDKVTVPTRRFPAGQAQVDEEVIESLSRHANPEIAEPAKVYALHEGLKSANSKWYGAWPAYTGPDGRLRTDYQQAKVVSGRLSATHVQLQAIPHDYQIEDIAHLVDPPLRSIREFFVARPGYRLWEFDVANAEPRIATMVARCAPMYKGIVIDGNDTHGVATLQMFRQVMGDDFGPGHPQWVEYRQVGKRCNLGILYAAGPGAIKHQIRKFTGVDYPFAQVSEWVNLYRAAFPQFVRATDWWSRFADKTGYVRAINGRLRYMASYEPIHKAFNQVIQMSVAETITDAMVQTELVAPDAMLLQTHDSLVLEVPDSQEGVAQFATAAAITRLTFEKAFRLRWKDSEPRRFMPFPVDAKAFGRTATETTKDEIAEMQSAIDAEYERRRPAWAVTGHEALKGVA